MYTRTNRTKYKPTYLRRFYLLGIISCVFFLMVLALAIRKTVDTAGIAPAIQRTMQTDWVMDAIQRAAPIPKHQLKIYVYDLPQLYNHQIAARKPWCDKEAFGTEIYIHEALLASPYITKNPEEAHLFFVPVYSACIVYRNFGNFKAYRFLVRKALQYIIKNEPYWNRTKGRDHIWAFVHDFGGCLSWHDNFTEGGSGIFYEELRNSIFLSHLGDLSSKCFDTHKDIVIPPMCTEEIYVKGRGGFGKNNRTIFAHFRGTVNWHFRYSIPSLGIQRGYDRTYSHGVRQRLQQLYAHDKEYFLFNEGSSPSYVEEVSQSIFCLCPRGFAAWSRRLFDSVMLGCIPVIIADDIELPFERFLDYSKFSVKIMERDVDRVKEILIGIRKDRIAEMQAELARIWTIFSYQRPPIRGDAFDFLIESLAAKAEKGDRVGPNAFY